MTTIRPEVVARYLTASGMALADPAITVDVVGEGGKAICRGCGDDWGNPDYPFTVRQWAQRHAETCRAMPAPTN